MPRCKGVMALFQPVDDVGLAAVALVGLAGAIGWGIRGSYGHEKGATLPGAMIALSICFVSERADWQQASLFIATVAAAGIAFGGCISYARVAGYARSNGYANALYGLACLFLIGGLWGGVGGCALGLVLARLSPSELLVAAVGVAICQQLVYYLLVKKAGLRMTPPRSDDWARSLGALLFLAALCFVYGERAGLVGLSYGFLGFGFGFVIGMFFQLLGARTRLRFNWWRLMECTIGFCGGAGLAWGLLPVSRSPGAELSFSPFWPVLGAYGTLWVIVVFHMGHNFRHYERRGALARYRGNRSAATLTRQWAVIAGLVLTAVLLAWHFWGPRDPRLATHVSLLGLIWACGILCMLLDAFLPQGAPRELTKEWYLGPLILFTLWSFFAPKPFAQPRIPVMGVAFLWAIALPATLVLAAVFSRISSLLWREDPPHAARRFGPGATHEDFPWVVKPTKSP